MQIIAVETCTYRTGYDSMVEQTIPLSIFMRRARSNGWTTQTPTICCFAIAKYTWNSENRNNTMENNNGNTSGPFVGVTKKKIAPKSNHRLPVFLIWVHIVWQSLDLDQPFPTLLWRDPSLPCYRIRTHKWCDHLIPNQIFPLPHAHYSNLWTTICSHNCDTSNATPHLPAHGRCIAFHIVGTYEGQTPFVPHPIDIADRQLVATPFVAGSMHWMSALLHL